MCLIAWGQRSVWLKETPSRHQLTETKALPAMPGSFTGIFQESSSVPTVTHCTILWIVIRDGIMHFLPSRKPTRNCRVRVWNQTPAFWCGVFLLMAKCGFRKGDLRCLKGKIFFQGNILIIRV